MSGAARRKLQQGKALAAGLHRTHYQTADIRDAVQSELAKQRSILAAQVDLAKARRERARHFAFQAQPPSGCSVLESVTGPAVLGAGTRR